MNDAISALSEHGIRLRDATVGNHKVVCPVCSHSRKKKNDPCLSVTIKDDGEAVWKCHHCGFSGGAGGSEYRPTRERRTYRRPVRASAPQQPETLVRYFGKRGISEAIVKRFGIYKTKHWFPQLEGEDDCIAFPYEWRGELRNVKYRNAEKLFVQEKDPEPVFYNADSIVAGEDLIITEGEVDVLSFAEAGFDHVVSLANGAPSEPEQSDKRYEPFGIHWEDMLAAKRILIATDMDGPGEMLAQEVARRVGKDRCWRVRMPNAGDHQTKDANECLTEHGAKTLQECVELATPWPIEGLYNALTFETDVLDLYYGRGPQPLSTGFGEFDHAFKYIPGQFIVVTGIPNHGKALALDTPIPTSLGWATMEELAVGDVLFDETGARCRVVRATEVMLGHDCYRVTFSDGTDVVADAGHQWLTTSEPARRSARQAAKRTVELQPRGTRQTAKRTFPAVVTTEQIAGSLVSFGKANHHVLVAGPIACDELKLPIPPYTLGAWLGDGDSAGGGLTCFDEEILRNIERDGFRVSPHSARGHYTIRGLVGSLRVAGLLKNKHVPPDYLRASEQQRLAILNGLMDTDGSAGGKHSRACEFCSTNERLADGAFELAASLGMKPTKLVGRATLAGVDCGPKYRVMFTTGISVFRLPRKLDGQGVGQKPRTDARAIVAVERVSSVPVRCIEVDSPSHLFLCSKSFIPTHNSRFIDQIIIQTSRLRGEKWALFSPETGSAQHLADLIEVWSGAPFYEGPTWRVSEADITEAMAWINEHVFLINTNDHTPTIDWILERGQAAVVRHGVRHLVVDPYNEVEAGRPEKQTETEFISQLISKCKRFGQRYDVTVWMMVHPTKLRNVGDDGKEPIPGLYDLSGSAHWRNKTDAGLVVYRDFEGAVTYVTSKKIRRQPICGVPGAVKFNFDPTSRRFDAVPGSFKRLGETR